jgi:hypothetical protein
LDQSALVSLMVELFTAIRLVSAYPAPAVLPEVHSFPQSEMRRRLCEGRPCSIKAYYHPDWGVVIDETLDVHHDPFDRSILLHELVHHLQKTTGKFEVVASFCSRRMAEELEAYEIQNRYLSKANTSRRALFMGSTGKCADADEAFRAQAHSQPKGD